MNVIKISHLIEELNFYIFILTYISLIFYPYIYIISHYWFLHTAIFLFSEYAIRSISFDVERPIIFLFFYILYIFYILLIWSDLNNCINFPVYESKILISPSGLQIYMMNLEQGENKTVQTQLVAFSNSRINISFLWLFNYSKLHSFVIPSKLLETKIF